MDRCDGLVFFDVFFDFKMRICHRCDLRQMGDADDLMALPDLCHFSETFCAVLPLIPVSISSKIKVSVSSRSARIVLIASMIRDSSPPETTFASGRIASPGFVEIKNSTASVPFSV